MADIIITIKIPDAAVEDGVQALRLWWLATQEDEEPEERPNDRALLIGWMSQQFKGLVRGLRAKRQTVNVEDVEIVEHTP